MAWTWWPVFLLYLSNKQTNYQCQPRNNSIPRLIFSVNHSLHITTSSTEFYHKTTHQGTIFNGHLNYSFTSLCDVEGNQCTLRKSNWSQAPGNLRNCQTQRHMLGHCATVRCPLVLCYGDQKWSQKSRIDLTTIIKSVHIFPSGFFKKKAGSSFGDNFLAAINLYSALIIC